MERVPQRAESPAIAIPLSGRLNMLMVSDVRTAMSKFLKSLNPDVQVGDPGSQ